MPTKLSAPEKKVMAMLAEVGGEIKGESGIERKGNKIVLPTKMTYEAAIKVMQAAAEHDEQTYDFRRVFTYRWEDVAVAFSKVVKDLTGSAARGQTTWSFFGKSNPSFVEIADSHNSTISVPEGQFNIDMFDGEGMVYRTKHRVYGEVGAIVIGAARKFEGPIQGLFKMIEIYLKENSIYRGKAFDGGNNFFDVSQLDPESVFYNADVTEQLQANVWGVIEHADAMRKANLGLKRAVLLHGRYGTGKSLAALLTAQKAVEHGWTYILCRPGVDSLEDTLKTAQIYQPSVVLFEDVDTVGDVDANTATSMSKMLDLFDGIRAKNTEILLVATTNFVHRIHQGLLRPGRMDAIIEIGALEAEATERMIRYNLKTVADDFDFKKAAKSLDGMLPAFAVEAIQRTKRVVVAQGGDPSEVTTEAVVVAADQLRKHVELMDGASERHGAPELGTLVGQAVVKELVSGNVTIGDADAGEAGDSRATLLPSESWVKENPKT